MYIGEGGAFLQCSNYSNVSTTRTNCLNLLAGTPISQVASTCSCSVSVPDFCIKRLSKCDIMMRKWLWDSLFLEGIYSTPAPCTLNPTMTMAKKFFLPMALDLAPSRPYKRGGGGLGRDHCLA